MVGRGLGTLRSTSSAFSCWLKATPAKRPWTQTIRLFTRSSLRSNQVVEPSSGRWSPSIRAPLPPRGCEASQARRTPATSIVAARNTGERRDRRLCVMLALVHRAVLAKAQVVKLRLTSLAVAAEKQHEIVRGHRATLSERERRCRGGGEILDRAQSPLRVPALEIGIEGKIACGGFDSARPRSVEDQRCVGREDPGRRPRSSPSADCQRRLEPC